MNAAVGDRDRVAIRERDGGFERGNGVVRDGTDRATREARHALDRQDAAARHERADGRQRIRDLGDVDRQVRRVHGHRHRAGLGPRHAIADLEQAPWPDAEERIPPDAFAALDRLEEVGGAAVVEAEEGADRGFKVGRTRRAQQDRVGIAGQTLRLGQAERIRRRHRVGL